MFPFHTPRVNHYPQKDTGPSVGWALRFAEPIPCQLEPAVTQFPHSLKEWNDEDNPKRKKMPSGRALSPSLNRGTAGGRLTSPAPGRPSPPRLQVPSSLPRALLPPAVLPINVQVSPLLGSSPAPSPSRLLWVSPSAPAQIYD